MFTMPLAFIAFFFGFSFLIFIHELGHFLVARWAGIKCTQFAIGMGTAICSWRRGIGFRIGNTESEYHKRLHEQLVHEGVKPTEVDGETKFKTADLNRAAETLGLGDTDYRLNWLPLGGYVKMLGQEDIDPNARSDDPNSFNSKTVGARMCVISAGVIMNIVLGVILLTWAFSIGVNFPTAIVGNAVPGLPAATTYADGHEGDPDYLGLQVGDQVIAIEGAEVKDLMDLRLGIALSTPGSTLDVKVRRPGLDEPIHFQLTPVVGRQELLAIGIEPIESLEVEGDLAKEQGVHKGMWLTAVNDQPVSDYIDYHRAIMVQPNRPSLLTFTDPKTGETATLTASAIPRFEQSKDGHPHMMGLEPLVRLIPVDSTTPAAEVGLQKGDIVARLGNLQWPNLSDLLTAIRKSDDQPLALVVLREGKRIDLGSVVPHNGKIGVAYGPAFDEPIIAATLDDSPLASLNLPAGSRLVTVNDQPIASWADFQVALAAAPSHQIKLSYIANIVGQPTEEATITLTDDQLATVRQTRWDMPYLFTLKLLKQPLKGDTLAQAAAIGFEKTGDFMTQAYLTIARLVQGSVKPKHLVGPIGIVDVGTRFTLEGPSYYLFFLGLLSVNLAVINFLPIPIVDGGHAVFLIIEKIKGSPVSLQIQAAATYVGLCFLGLLFVVVTYYDIMRLF